MQTHEKQAGNREAIYSLIGKEKAAQIIEKTEELLQWLKAQIL